jgi:hypothetical protein
LRDVWVDAGRGEEGTGILDCLVLGCNEHDKADDASKIVSLYARG